MVLRMAVIAGCDTPVLKPAEHAFNEGTAFMGNQKRSSAKRPVRKPVTAPNSHRSTRSFPTLQNIKGHKIPAAHRSRFTGDILVRSATAAAHFG
jgi:hypothetical protein